MAQEVRLRAGQHSEIRFWMEKPGQASDSDGANGGNGERRWDRIVAPVSKEPCLLQPLEKYEVQP
jgi:hypothetical protein